MFARNMIVTLVLLAATIVEAQPQVHRIGVLVPELGRAQSQASKGLSDELKRLGYQERKNLRFETRDAKGDRGALLAMAKDLVGQKVEAIFTTGTRATQAAMSATRDIPIVFIHPGDPIASGLLTSSGGAANNITGVAAFAARMTETRLKLFKEIIPTLEKIHVFFDSNNSYARENFALVESAAAKFAVKVIGHGVKSVEELKATVNGLRSENGAGIFHIPDDLVESEATLIFDVARQNKLPTMFNEEAWAISGALAAYGPNYLEMGRQAGRLVDQIVKGQKPASLPIERAATFALTLNYRTANVIGLRLSQEMLKKADKVIR